MIFTRHTAAAALTEVDSVADKVVLTIQPLQSCVNMELVSNAT